MIVRRVLEWSIFIFYWLGFASFAIGVIYWRLLVQEYEIQEKFGRWQSFAVFLLILLILYFIVRRLALWVYAKCKVSEKKMLHNMKKEVRDLKRDNQNSNYQANLAFEHEKQTRKSKRNKIKLKRGHSLEDLPEIEVNSRTMKNARSLETVLQSQRYRLRNARPEIDSQHSSFQFYEEQPTRYATPPPAYHTLPLEYYDNDDEYVVFSKLPPNKNQKRIRSAEYVLDLDETHYDLHASRSLGNIYQNVRPFGDEVDGTHRKLRKAPAPPPPGAKRSKSLNRIPNKSKSLHKNDTHYSVENILQHTHHPLQQCSVEVHQPQQLYYNRPRTHLRQSRPDMVKQVLVTNTFQQQT